MKRSGSALFDGDAAASSELVRHRRARTSVGDANDAFRVRLLTDWLAVQGDLDGEVAILAAAQRYDNTYPGEPSLVDELAAAVEGDEWVRAA
ncbi:hypothetical protein RM844_30195 [Streptomyces sp. DSM 44915]|uniref:Uncharacterized protein n=1 Tax=Streptomyces chisholmiae TaxID=3075540 RepID=A0ABU2JZZ1_9ACTN|nr:hypothetical protein [Streptomyces sp. DSM 44915]MDT0270552.1 hypothetical protein [Streptomyces sp. DSM 44915]